MGNFNKDYDEKYEPRDTLDFKWENKQGLNQGKNVIILMVESWGCNISYICGKGPSYMPKLEKLAKENMFFSDYHSVVQSTSLSVSAVLKSNPVITLSDEEKLKKYPKALYKGADNLEFNVIALIICSWSNGNISGIPWPCKSNKVPIWLFI